MTVPAAESVPTLEAPAHRRSKAHSESADEGKLRVGDSVPVFRDELPADILKNQLHLYVRTNERIGEKTSHLPALTPGRFNIRKIALPVCKKMAAPDAIEDEIVTVQPLWTVFHRNFADIYEPSAGLLVDKFRDHLRCTASKNAWSPAAFITAWVR